MDYSASSNNSPSTPRISNSDRRLLPACPQRPRSSSNSSISISAVATNDDEEMSQQMEKGIPFFPKLASVSSASSTCMTLMSGNEAAAVNADTSPKRKRNHIEEHQNLQITATDNTTELRIHDISTCQQKVPKLQPRFQSRPVHDDRKPSSRRTSQQSDVHNVSATSIDFSSSITSVDLPFLDLSLKEEMAATNTALNDLDLDFVWDKAEIDKMDKWMCPKKKK